LEQRKCGGKNSYVSFGLNRCFLGILKDESVLVYGSFETKETWRGDGGIGSEKIIYVSFGLNRCFLGILKDRTILSIF
jgi:hypothetical protein